MNRYHRQTILPQIGEAGQRRLAESRVLLIGCGALGSVIAEQLVRAGVGFLRLCDRDIVELTNLQRQVLFDESDAAGQLPKALAAQRRLRQINSSVEIDARAVDVHSGNIEELINISASSIGNRQSAIGNSVVDLILDGTDNVETRYLINDVAVKHGIPWIYGACVGTEGRVMTIRPGETPCLRCVFPEPPEPAELDTCDTAGVLGPAAAVVASLQSIAAIRLLVGDHSSPNLIKLDLWRDQFRTIPLDAARRPDCPACGRREFAFLSAGSSGATTLCGRDAVQIRPSSAGLIDLNQLAERLRPVADVRSTAHVLRFGLADGIMLTVFPDARAIVHGTTDPARARSIYARYVGS